MQTTTRLLMLCASLLPLTTVAAQEPGATNGNAWRYLLQGNGCKLILPHDGHKIEIVFRDGKVQSIDGKDAGVKVEKTKTGGSRITTADGTDLLVIESVSGADALNRFSASAARRAHLGVNMGRVDESLAAHLDVQPDQVTMVLGVGEGQPAEKAGIQKFDIIIAVDGETPATEEKVRQAIASKKPGDELTLKLLRRSGEKTVKVTLGETTEATWRWPTVQYNDAFKGFTLQNPSPYLLDSRLKDLALIDGGKHQDYTVLGQLLDADKKKAAAAPDTKADLESIKKQLDRLDEILKKLGDQIKDR
jgi:hypothetical protein